MNYQFTVNVNGRVYQCERIVTGQRVLRQQIRVTGVGSKNDPASYGAKYHPPGTMEAIARLIAREIIAGI